jgi:hypothetical protein
MAIVLPKFPRSGVSTRLPKECDLEAIESDSVPVMIELTGFQPGYMPNQELRFQFTIRDLDIGLISAIEASVVWVTDGKGNEDLGVHFFQRLTGEAISDRDWSEPQSLSTILPESPLSYEGRLLKIRWCIRVRLYLNDGNELVAQEPFYLGTNTREI